MPTKSKGVMASRQAVKPPVIDYVKETTCTLWEIGELHGVCASTVLKWGRQELGLEFMAHRKQLTNKWRKRE